MPLRVQCSAGHLMMVPDHRAGTVLRCPNCGIDVQVPGQAAGPAKALGQPRLPGPTLARSPAVPAISGAGEQSPQVAGHSTGPKSGIGQGAPRVLAKPRVKPPPSPAAKKPVDPPLVVVPPAAPIGPAELVASPNPVAEPDIQWGEVQPASIPLGTIRPPTAADIVFAEVQTKPEKAEKKADLPVTRRTTVDAPQKPPTTHAAPQKPRWQIEQPEPAPPKSQPGGSNRPRATVTGTILAPETPIEPPIELPPKPAARKQTEPKPLEAKPAPRAPEPVHEKAPLPVAERPVEPEPIFLAEPPPIAAPADAPISFHSAATQVEPYVPPPPAPPITLVQGVMPTASQRITVWQLAAALLAAAILSIGPSLWEIGDYLSSDGEQSVRRWAYLLLILGVVQIGCLALLVQVPDWSSVWIATIQSLAFAAIYAAVLGLTVITGGDSTLIDALQLGFQYTSGKAPLWCLCLAATYASLAFFAGRFSAKWRKLHRQMQASDEAAVAH
jgi:hypothetical protein